MGVAMVVRVTRLDVTAEDMRREAARSKDSTASRRMLAMALVLEGKSRAEAAESCGMDRQTLRDWVYRFNELGLAGLTNKPHSGGPQARLTGEQKAELMAWVQAGPNVEEDGLVRWRLVDLAARIKERFSVSMQARSVGRILHGLNFRRISVRPRHPKADLAAQEAHKKTLPIWSQPSSPATRKANPSSCGGRTRRGSARNAV